MSRRRARRRTSSAGGTTRSTSAAAGASPASWALYLENPPAYNTLNINDGSDTTARTVTLSSYTPSGDTAWGSITGLARAAINYRYADTASVNLNTGTVSDTVNVLATGVPTYLNGGWNDTVNVGNGGTVAGILGTLYLENPPAYNTLNINDASDTTARTVTLSSYTPSGDSAWGSITGLAPAAIDYRYADTTSLNLTTGSGDDTVNVQTTGVTTYLNSLGAQTVVVGNNASVAGIDGTLFVDSWQTTLDLEDSSRRRGAHRRPLHHLDARGPVLEGSITGLAPAAINFLWANIAGGVNATSGWEVHWDVNPNAMEPQVGQVQVTDDGIGDQRPGQRQLVRLRGRNQLLQPAIQFRVGRLRRVDRPGGDRAFHRHVSIARSGWGSTGMTATPWSRSAPSRIT